MFLDVIVTNAHSGGNSQQPAYVSWLAGQDVALAFVSEAHSMLDALKRAGEVHAGAIGHGPREVATVTRRLDILQWHTTQLTRDMGTPIAHDRWATRIRFTVDGVESVAYSVHANAAIQNALGFLKDSPGALEWARGLAKLKAMLAADIAAGLSVIIGGDFNWHDTEAIRPHSPAAMFRSLGLAYFATELLWLAWSPAAFLLATSTTLPHPPGSDHVALRGRLAIRTKETTMAKRYPDASFEPLGAQTEDRMRAHDIVCLHTMVGSLLGTDSMFEQDGFGGTESHFGTGGMGEKIKQWQDLAFTADANLEGNPRVISIENADKGPGFPAWTGSDVPAFTDKQVSQLVDLVAWLCSKEAHSACPADWKCHQFGIPAVLVPDSKPTRRGIAYHRQGIDGSLPDMRVAGGEHWSTSTGKICPGDRRVDQLKRVIIPRVAAKLNPPKPDRVARVKAALLAVLNGDDATTIPVERIFVRTLLAAIRTTVNRLPES